jgi:hypothetical protein
MSRENVLIRGDDDKLDTVTDPSVCSRYFAGVRNWVPPQWRKGFQLPQKRLPEGCWQLNQEQERNFTGTWSWFLKKLRNIDGWSLNFVAGSNGGLSKLIDLRLKKFGTLLKPRNLNPVFLAGLSDRNRIPTGLRPEFTT